VHVLGPRFGWPLVPIERHICTMATARYHGLPGALEKVAEQLELPVQKDAAGKRLMLRLSRPGRDGRFVEPTADELKQLIAYCRRDVEVERAIFHALKALPATEQALWQLDRRINDRGFAIDVALATRARMLAATEKENINARLRAITDGAVAGFTKIEAIRKFVNARGHDMAKLNKRAVTAALAHDVDDVVREVLELRQAAACNTEAKFDAVLATALPDHRSYGLLHFYGTHTGRWTSSGFNVHNLPREAGEHIGAAIAIIQAGDLERLRNLGLPLELIASIVRGLVVAPPGKRLLVGDFSTIEPRIAAWLANETWKIENFYAFDRTGDPALDTYRVLGAKMRGKPVDPNDGATRQHGKTVTMAFTFGAGVRVWRQHVPDDPRSDDEIKAQEVLQFRRLHPKQTEFMYTLEAQALHCVASGKPVNGARHSFAIDGDTLMMTLPSGRTLFYPRVRLKPGKFGKSVIAYYKAKTDCEAEMWYGSWIAHLVSATARDLLVNALFKLDVANFEVVLHVHDEVVAEIDTDAVDTKAFQRCMLDAPEWAEGLPLAAKVRSGTRYIKAETARSAELAPGEIKDTPPAKPAPKPPIKPAPISTTTIIPPAPASVQKPKPAPAPKPAAAAPAASEPPAAPKGKRNGHTVAWMQSSIAFPAFDASEMTTIDLAELISEPVPKNRKICCPFHDETTPSLHIYPDHYYCFGCHAYGDHIDWLTQVEGLSHTAAQERLSNWRGAVISPAAGPSTPTLEDIEQAEKDRAYTLRWWDAAKPIKGTLAARYLAETRGIDLDLLPDDVDDVLRFHPNCVFGPSTRHPCLITLMRDARGNAPIGIQRTALTPEAKKIDRRMLGLSGVVKLWPASSSLVVGEGLETVLAAATRLDYRGEPLRPAWAALSDGALKKFPIIDGVERLIVLADNDANNAGAIAAETCKRRWLEAGRRVALLMPDRSGTDFNDIVLDNLKASS
jgi:DNA polymerase